MARRYAVLRPYLDERQRRLALAAEAVELGRGGITVVAQATGVHPDTVTKGVRELEGRVEPAGRVRAPVVAASQPPRPTQDWGRR